MSRSTQLMTPDEIVSEIDDLRESMNTSAQRVMELSRALYSHTRRAAVDNNTSAYIAYSNAWMRFSGALAQGLKRTAHTGRVLKHAREETARQEQEAVRKAMELERRKEKQAIRAAQVAPLGDLIELYGEEMVRDASR